MPSDKEPKVDKLSVLLLDVAGTTTSLEYIQKKLFAFIVEESPTFLKEHLEDEEVKTALKELQGNDKDIDLDSSVEIIKKLTDENSNNKHLKSLQALISKVGYEKGTLKAHIFQDVKMALETWSKEKIVVIYSSGDIEAQKLLFSNTVEGNLTSHISKFFDMSVGAKTASESYSKISEELKVKCEEIVFVSDDVDELKAAKEAGLITALIKRDGNADVSEDISKEFTFTISSLADLPIEGSNKRKVEDFIDGTETPPSKLPKTEKNEKKKETILAPSEEKPITDNNKESTKTEAEAMEVDSTSVEVETKKSDEQNVPTRTETSMETEELVGDKAVIAEPEKTEAKSDNAKPKITTENDTSDETEGKTEILNDTNKTGLDKSTEKDDKTETKTDSTPVDAISSIPIPEQQNNIEVKGVDTNDSNKLTNDKASESTVDVEVDACNELSKKTCDQKDQKEAENSKDACNANLKLEENKEELEKNNIEISEETKDRKIVEEISNGVEGDSNEENVKTNDIKGTIEANDEASPKNEKVGEKMEENNCTKTTADTLQETALNTHENGSATETQNGISNGVANGKDSSDKSSNGQNDEATDIKVKKTESTVESPTVAVEV